MSKSKSGSSHPLLAAILIDPEFTIQLAELPMASDGPAMGNLGATDICVELWLKAGSFGWRWATLDYG
jgi:hypothetical protein